MRKTSAVSIINQHGHPFILYNIQLTEEQLRAVNTGKEKKEGVKDYVLFFEDGRIYIDDSETDFLLANVLNVNEEDLDLISFLQNFNEEIRYVVGKNGNWAALHYSKDDQINYSDFYGIFNYFYQMKAYLNEKFKTTEFEVEKRDLPHIRKIQGEWCFYNWKGLSLRQNSKNVDLYTLINQPVNF